jgi:hypothetical protein
MPTPEYLDLSLYIPAGGVDGFELNGFAVNGVGFVDSPFAGSTFALDPYRSILAGEPQETDLRPFYPSMLAADPNLSVQVSADISSEVWAARCSAEVISNRSSSAVGPESVSLKPQVEDISSLSPEYRTSYVLASHPSSLSPSRGASELDKLPPSRKAGEIDISYVPAEDRTSRVRRI